MDCPTNYIHETTRCVCNFITCMILTARCTHRKCIRSILQHFTLNLEVGLNILHLCVFFYLQFLFCTILKLSPAARCADHVSHQFCSKKQPIIILAICVLHFSIVHFIFYLQPIFPISFAAKVKIAFTLQSLLLYNFNFAATDHDLCGHRAR